MLPILTNLVTEAALNWYRKQLAQETVDNYGALSRIEFAGKAANGILNCSVAASRQNFHGAAKVGNVTE